MATSKLTAKGLATRGRIVDAATELVAQQGIAGTSIDDVRRAAGVSGSQMSHYFADKCELVRAVIGRSAEQVMAVQAPHVDRLDSVEAIERWAQVAIDTQRALDCRGGCPLGSLAAEVSGVDGTLQAEVAAHMAAWEDRIRAGLRTMADRGELVPGADPDVLATALLTALQGGLLMADLRGDVAPLEAVMGMAVAQVRASAVPAAR